MIDTVDFSVQKMKRLLSEIEQWHFMMRSSPRFPWKSCCSRQWRPSLAAEPKPVLEILEPGLVVLANWARLERVIGHLIQNAIEATPRDGQVRVRLSRQEDAAIIEVKDSGHGMSEEFIRERLFKPFESTKSAGMGIGVFESREYVRELGGQLEVASQPARGHHFPRDPAAPLSGSGCRERRIA